MGGESCSRACEFESQHKILDGYYSHLFPTSGKQGDILHTSLQPIFHNQRTAIPGKSDGTYNGLIAKIANETKDKDLSKSWREHQRRYEGRQLPIFVWRMRDSLSPFSDAKC